MGGGGVKSLGVNLEGGVQFSGVSLGGGQILGVKFPELKIHIPTISTSWDPPEVCILRGGRLYLLRESHAFGDLCVNVMILSWAVDIYPCPREVNLCHFISIF